MSLLKSTVGRRLQRSSDKKSRTWKQHTSGFHPKLADAALGFLILKK